MLHVIRKFRKPAQGTWGVWNRIGAVIIPGLILLVGCAEKPILDALIPDRGPPGTLVEIQGDDLTGASVRWDSGTPSEQSLPSSFFSARFFTVPLGASLGLHPVRLYGDGEYSDDTRNFDVTAGLIRPDPRVDDVTVSLYSVSGGSAAMILMVHGANIDVGSTILVDGVAKDTFASRGLRNPNLEATDPSTLGYPIFHYTTVWTYVDNLTPGGNINVSVRNLDGATSNALVYRVAASTAELDSDGDGLLDDWEEHGYDADGDGTIDIDLPQLGANPLRKDVFIEVDWMSTSPPNNAIWGTIQNAFANAPVLNSDGSQGITVHIDRGATTGGGGGDVLTHADGLRYDDAAPDPTLSYENFYTLKSDNFDANRLNIFRYCIFAWDNGHSPGASGRAEAIWSNDFFVSVASWGNDGTLAAVQAPTFIHELGHTLNLRHGGFENTNYKPNYNSIMTYGGGAEWNAADSRCRRRFFTPSQFGGIDNDCDLANTHNVYTYSQGMRAALDETSLDERDGVCDGSNIDWDMDGNPNESGYGRDINCDGSRTGLQDHADWGNIEWNFRDPRSGWNNN